MTGRTFCAGTRRDGKPCGRKVPSLPSGVVVYRYCWQHRAPTLAARRGTAETGDDDE